MLDAAAELAVDPGLIEKDWHATRLLSALAGFSQGEVRLVFSGGTSLSKGHGLIQRFSEDLDFKASGADGLTRPQRKALVAALLDRLEASDWQVKNTQKGNENRFFRAEMAYPRSVAPPSVLRPELKLEITLEAPVLPSETRALSSLLAKVAGRPAEVPAMPCVAAVETAADKLGALTWRLLSHPAGAKDYDPTLLRHLHDLAALTPMALGDARFRGHAHAVLVRDLKDRGRDDMPPDKALDALLELLAEAPYARNYAQFVDAMAFGRPEKQVGFDAALAALRQLVASLR